MIPFNKPYFTGKETEYIEDAVSSGKISGNGNYTQKCHYFFERRYGFRKCLLTSSCTDALEMAALLCNLEPGDEVIIPSYTFVSTALAFVRVGAKIIFADSQNNHPNIDTALLEKLITPKTKVIVPVHYAGIACDMDKIMEIAEKNNLLVVEDAAQAINAYYKHRPLGAIGHLSTFSFHETKNIISGEGGMLVINDERFIRRAEIIWEKGTNRAEFFRGEVSKYNWVDIGSSFLPSEITAAFLYAQLEHIEDIQSQRNKLWNYYYTKLKPLEKNSLCQLPIIPEYSSNNAHIFYILLPSENIRNNIVNILKEHNILAVSHYISLHNSPYYLDKHDGRELYNSDKYTKCLLRLPMFYELSFEDINIITNIIINELSHNTPR